MPTPDVSDHGLPQAHVHVRTPEEAQIEPVSAVLLSARAVLVPDPPAWLLARNTASAGQTENGGPADLTVMISWPPENARPTETIPVVEMTRSRLDSPHLQSSCVVLALATPAPFALQGQRHSVQEMADALHRHTGDLWQVMAGLGRTAPPPIGRRIPEERADAAGTAVPAGLDGAASDHDGIWDSRTDSPVQYFRTICDVCKCCLTPPEPSQRDV